jgi:hypothetical protein
MESKDSAYSNLWNLFECLNIETFFLICREEDISFLGWDEGQRGLGSSRREVRPILFSREGERWEGEGAGKSME